MPKATKKPQSTTKTTKPTTTKPDDKNPEPSNPLPIPKPNYDPIAPIHFEELSNISESDRRIPTIASLTRWALARNLNPMNVNNWWYRRKAVAKKFKIKIPSGTYELDVGIPPVLCQCHT